MGVYCYHYFLKYCLNTFQQYYIAADNVTMVWNVEYSMILDKNSIHFSKTSANVMDNYS